jgi:hypothetical protein
MIKDITSSESDKQYRIKSDVSLTGDKKESSKKQLEQRDFQHTRQQI